MLPASKASFSKPGHVSHTRQQDQPSVPPSEKHHTYYLVPPPKMQRFTRAEDITDLEGLGIQEHRSRSTSRDMYESIDTERTRRYIETHTTFLNSADTEGSGYIPNFSQRGVGYSAQDYHVPMNDPTASSMHSLSSQTTTSRTPAHYPSSLAEDEGFTAPGTPHSFLSSPSLGYSHTSRPLSQTGFWVDQGASSLNLIMPSSAMFVKSREPTIEGEKLGFVKMMVTGQNWTWNSILIQGMFKWDGIIANDFDDEFLQEQGLDSDSNNSPMASETPGSVSVQDLHSSPGVQETSSNESSGHAEDLSPPQRKRDQYHGPTETIIEHFASSMVLPSWARAGFDEQDIHQEILVKNICFVDTPGYNAFSNPDRVMDLIISYLGLQFQVTNKFFSRSALSDDSLGRFLANNSTGAHSHVDLCLYVIEGGLTEIDIQCMRRLQSWVNLVPVLLLPLTSSNTDSGNIDVGARRQDLIQQLKEHEIEIFGMVTDDDGSPEPHPTNETLPLFSTAVVSDEDISPPPLSLDVDPLPAGFASPPFIFYIPDGHDIDATNRSADANVQQVDMVSDGNEHESGFVEEPSATSSPSPSAPAAAAAAFDGQNDLESLRQWVYVNHLAALRHRTTLKFLDWRRTLPATNVSSMNSSQELGSSRQLHHSFNQHGQILHSYQPELNIGSRRNTVSTATTHSTPTLITGAQLPLTPMELVSNLRARDQKRISERAARVVETHGQVFERILREREEVWRRALENMEREQRIDFLVQELKRWATEVPLQGQQSRPTLHARENMNNTDGSRVHTMGLGLGSGHSQDYGPLFRGVMNADQPEHSRPSDGFAHRRNGRSRGTRRRSTNASRRSRQSNDQTCMDSSGVRNEEGTDDEGDPLGLGLWASRFFGTLGKRLYQFVVMVGMGSLATWVYTHFLERVTWIE
ncbi:hypothetical protein BGZ51_002977 [Haplosporangium sp. Z 767]|nr:hypothetical protein BGZ51_002977 [Haplosporangium sp. Z 767]KAF9188646.1 hypothetical protein BGZ50_001225 [Haplosporangium sp. Z 11]